VEKMELSCGGVSQSRYYTEDCCPYICRRLKFYRLASFFTAIRDVVRPFLKTDNQEKCPSINGIEALLARLFKLARRHHPWYRVHFFLKAAIQVIESTQRAVSQCRQEQGAGVS
jgi:hypothetical protein